MCGIVGYVGSQSASEIILDGLSRLEYRGYDSAGISILKNAHITTNKKQGRLAILADSLSKSPIEGNIGIGHTRWATHGAPSDENSHPHYNEDRSISVVHNGIIENYLDIQKDLIAKGYHFTSETDTEVIAHLLDMYYEGDIFEALYKVLDVVKGAYALGILQKDHPDQLICARKDSPLVIGVGKGENFIASDVPALLKYTKDVYFLENDEVAILTKEGIEVFNKDKEKVIKEKVVITWDLDQATKGGYPHFMLKEIYEQPKGIEDTLKRRTDENGFFDFSDISLTNEDLNKINNIYIIACGTAYNAGLQGKFALQKIAKIKADTDISSEFRYSDPFIDDKSLVILLSQSGETLDTLAALREAKAKGAKTLAVTNVIGSSVAREADDVIYTLAGPEIAVASTKAYTTQVAVFYMLSLYLAKGKGIITDEEYKVIRDELYSIPEKIEEIFKFEDKIEAIATKITKSDNGFFLGRGLDYSVAVEAALKVKEVSYMHTEAFAAGELKHGTIALIEDGVPVIALATQMPLFEKSLSNMKEVKARGAYVLGITQTGNTLIEEVADDVLYIPEVSDLISGLLSIVPLQLLAYHISNLRGIDVDKPRNLAKSVTVE
jgi:glucosamine--fructose-6-phosphate aminotransferase (isomerizing)